MVEETGVPDENHRLTLHGLMENGFHIKVAYAVHFSDTLFISVLLLFSSSSYAKYMLPERAPDQKYIKHQKRERCRILWQKPERKTFVVLQTQLLFWTGDPLIFKK